MLNDPRVRGMRGLMWAMRRRARAHTSGRQSLLSQIDCRPVLQPVGDAGVVFGHQRCASRQQPTPHRGRHEEGTEPRFAVHGQVVQRVDAGELHGDEVDIAGALGVGVQLLRQQGRF